MASGVDLGIHTIAQVFDRTAIDSMISLCALTLCVCPKYQWHCLCWVWVWSRVFPLMFGSYLFSLNKLSKCFHLKSLSLNKSENQNSSPLKSRYHYFKFQIVKLIIRVTFGGAQRCDRFRCFGLTPILMTNLLFAVHSNQKIVFKAVFSLLLQNYSLSLSSTERMLMWVKVQSFCSENTSSRLSETFSLVTQSSVFQLIQSIDSYFSQINR